MRLIIDLQGVQSPGSRHRGIGRYSLAVAEAMARHARGHEVWLALNGAIPDTIESLRAAFDTLIPQERIVTWEAVAPVSDFDAANHWRRKTSEVLREAFLANLKPDFVHVTSLFEGLSDDVVSSVGAFSDGRNVGVTLYDLIPLIHHDPYLADSRVEAWYYRKLDHMRRASLWLAISESSRNEGITHLSLPEDRVVNISAAADDLFRPVTLSADERNILLQRYGLTRPFVMYTAATDPRKNLTRLFSAYAKLPEQIRREYQLLIVCPGDSHQVSSLKQIALQKLAEHDVVIASRVPDDDLVALYSLCATFCFPSLHEGFGLPALEAMQCGAATIGSNLSSIPEVIGRSDALFDPRNEDDIAARLYQVLSDPEFRRELAEHGIQRARKFSWRETARRAWEAFEANHEQTFDAQKSKETYSIPRLLTSKRPRLAYILSSLACKPCDAKNSWNLLPELSRHYNIDLITDQPTLNDPWIKANCLVRDLSWFNQNADKYDRIVYGLESLDCGRELLNLLERYPGIVVLSDASSHRPPLDGEVDQERRHFALNTLYFSHGYLPFRQKLSSTNVDQFLDDYASYYLLLQNAKGIILHDSSVRQQISEFFGRDIDAKLSVIPEAVCLRSGSSENRSIAANSTSMSPRVVADKYNATIEYFSANGLDDLQNSAVKAVTAIDPSYQDERDWLSLARALAWNLQAQTVQRQLFIDVSELVQRDSRTGIQRVTRSILSELLDNPPPGFRAEPVYAIPGRQGYYYARNFTLNFLGDASGPLEDAPIEFRRGDVFLGLDLQHHVVIKQEAAYSAMRKLGVKIYFVVYDILPIQFPQYFRDGIADWHVRWLTVLAKYSDGLVCISRSVADDVTNWLDDNPVSRERPISVQWFHLGADIDKSIPTDGLPDNAEQVLALISANPSFLMVGTIEPRKGHAQILQAFEQLWKKGTKVNLVLVGQQGWGTEDVLSRLRSHSELGKRLFWLEGISDEYLEQIYAASACLIAASQGEGFGLPLIEAARHGIPILARDIPVFREVAGEYAAYFDGTQPSDAAHAVENWLTSYASERHPKSDSVPWLTWAESAAQLKAVLLKKRNYKTWSLERGMATQSPMQPTVLQETMDNTVPA